MTPQMISPGQPMLDSSTIPRQASALQFAGYAALFDKVDAGGDILRRGAFRRSIEQHRITGKLIPLLWQHRPDVQIGNCERITEDDRGLRVIARLDDPESKAARMLREGILRGISFGYHATSSSRAKLNTGRDGRELFEVELIEVSLVTRPMQHGARVHFVS